MNRISIIQSNHKDNCINYSNKIKNNNNNNNWF